MRAKCAALVVVIACLSFTFAQEVAPAEIAGIVDDKPVATERENAAEYRAFNRFVRLARAASPEMLAQAAAPGVTARQLYEEERSKYRGQIVRVTGQLKRLKKVPANAELTKAGIGELYEGWVEDKFAFDKPTCVVFTDAPDIAPADEIKETYVLLDGYSFKRVKDPVQGLAPLVIGRSLKRQDTTGDSASRALTDPRCDCPQEWLEHIEDDTLVQSAKDNPDEFQAYNYFLLRARQVPGDLMAKHSRPELTFRRLFDANRSKYRGEIVHVEGRLKRLTWIDSNSVLEREGVKTVYEAWIFPPEYLGNPTCVLLTELPPGLKPADDIPGLWASFDGYFFKRYKYKAVDATRLAPLAIGRTLTLKDPPVSAEDHSAFTAYANYFVPVAIVLIVLMAGTIFTISRYLRSGDRAVRARLQRQLSVEFVSPPAEPTAAGSPSLPFDPQED